MYRSADKQEISVQAYQSRFKILQEQRLYYIICPAENDDEIFFYM